jgi:hypothetical protein
MKLITGKLYSIQDKPFFYIGNDNDNRFLFLSKDKDENGLSATYILFSDGKNYRDTDTKKIVSINEIN